MDPEMPIMDGSSEPFVDLIEKAGISEQDASKTWYCIDENIYLQDEKKRVDMVAMPAPDYSCYNFDRFQFPGFRYAACRIEKYVRL
jgi:UDP-3-O-[3-hydroxymyristoyl] N-acetylglucosamine deacetylase/3-hydroxyacyl-[acyl-carrier-protein] dehydratase